MTCYGKCAQCGGSLTMDHKCPWWAKYPQTAKDGPLPFSFYENEGAQPPDDDLTKARQRITELEAALREAASEMEIVTEIILYWGQYNSEYAQRKYNLKGDVDRYKQAAQKAREVANG